MRGARQLSRTQRFWPTSWIMLFAALAWPACTTVRIPKSQPLHIQTEPPGVRVWEDGPSGKKIVGTTPFTFEASYDQVERDFNENWWWTLLIGAAGIAAGGALHGAYENRSDPNQDLFSGAIIMYMTSGSILAGQLLLLGILQSFNGSEPEERWVRLGTLADGYEDQSMDVLVPSEQQEVSMVLKRVAAPGPLATQSPPSSAEQKPTPTAEIVAVFAISDSSGRVAPAELAQLTDFLATALARSGQFKVIPQDYLRQRLGEAKSGSYKACVDESCQIELGKAVAAQKTLSTQLLKVGDRCAVTSNLYDLKTEAAIRGAMVKTGCSTNELLGAMEQVASQLVSW